ncbi:MAG TPA: riboflavin synthase [Victivallales bacterium]|nr:riboflavin synthase [Victivallales bacterium]
MFTGLVETTGILKNRIIKDKEGILEILPDNAFENLKLGESIAINGTCLTLSQLPASNKSALIFNVLSESFKRTNLGDIKIGGKVNLERALCVGDRLGGHIVQGHVDCVGIVENWEKRGRDWELFIKFPDHMSPSFIEKGSVALDGVSLTIVSLDKTVLSVHLIPTTLNDTSLFDRKKGDKINIESDVIGKYVKRLIETTRSADAVSMSSLINAGWE